jgi:hypothetical protein
VNKITNLFFALGLVGMLWGNAYADLSDGLVADYPFNGNANDESGHGYDGTVIGAVPCEDRNGDANRAYCFDGADDYINVGQQPNFPSWDTYAISVWFLNDGGGDQGNGYGQKIIDKTTWYTDFYLSVSCCGNGWLVWKTYQGGSGAIVDQSDYTDGEWHHVVVNKNGTSGELWIDGQLVGTSESIKTVNNNQPLLFGYSVSGDGFQRKYWSGKIDDIRIYNRELSEDEIEQLRTIEVTIDIKPGSDPNCFNVDGNGVIPVAILGSNEFDVDDIDTNTLDFAGLKVRVKGNSKPQCSFEQVNTDDTILDMVCQFVDDPGSWSPGDGEATLTGNLQDGTPFEGTDSICIVPPAE